VRAEVPKGKNAGIHIGRVAVRATGSFRAGNIEGINATHCKLIEAGGRLWLRPQARPSSPQLKLVGGSGAGAFDDAGLAMALLRGRYLLKPLRSILPSRKA
jgi:hypothetical protein